MGSIGAWGRILVIATFGGLYAWTRDIGHKPYINKLRRPLAGWILFSSAVCIWCTFRWRAFAAPLVFITAPAAVAGVILTYFARPRGGQQVAAELSADKHK